MVAACYITTCACFCPDEHAEAGASQKEQRQEQGRQQREADALKQQEKLRRRKEKKERRQSLAANTAAPRLSHVAQTDAGALPLFPEQKTDAKVSCCLPWLTCTLAAQAALPVTAAAQWVSSSQAETRHDPIMYAVQFYLSSGCATPCSFAS